MTSPATPIRFLLYPSLGQVKDHVRAEFFGRALSARVGRPVVLEVAPTYEMVEEELLAGRVDLVWATTDQCDRFEASARAVLRAVRGGRWTYHAVFICRADAPLDLGRLRGTRAAWVAPMSVGGYLLPRRHLAAQGLPPDEVFSEQRFVGSYRKALVAVLEGEADVASIYTSHADEHTVRALLAERVGSAERRLTPFAFTAPVLADGIIVTHRLPEADAAVLVAALTGMRGRGAGQDLLVGPFGTEGFVRSPVTQQPRPVAARAPGQSEYLMVALDDAGRCQRLWAPTGEAFGRDVRGGEGRLLAEVVGPEAAAPLVALARAVRHRGMGGRAEYCLDIGGEGRWYSAEATEPAEGAEATDLLVRNVTELRAQEDALYRLASFPQLQPDPLLELDLRGRLRYANPAAQTAFPDLLMQGGGEHPLVEAALASARSVAASEVPRAVVLAGRHWELRVAALPDADGVRVFARDVTVRKEMETRLIRSDRFTALGSMAAAVCHEMNNPLAFMLSNLAFAREELARVCEERRARGEAVTPELDEVLEVLGETADGADRLKNIVQDLKMLSRGPSPHGARVNVHLVLEDSLKLMRNELRDRARLEKELHPVPMVAADEARLGQVFLNLLLTAAEAMAQQDAARNVLRVRTRSGPQGEAIIEIQDTGPGHPPEVLERLFEPFFSTNPSTTGLGLSVSHAIVTGLGGTLRAESQEGEGTTFIVCFPAEGAGTVGPRREPLASEPLPPQRQRGAA
jgi:signal transduction histidine kinase/ABC-type phosphate/phosphonate transport system substrate-binding protein